MVLHRNILFLILLPLTSVQCKNKVKLMEWCLNGDFKDVNEKIVDKESCKTRPCVISTCPYMEMNYNKTCIKMADLKLDFSEILTLYKMESGKPVKTNKKLDNESFQIVNYVNRSAHTDETCTNKFRYGKYFRGHFLEDGSFLLLRSNTILPAGEYIVRFVTRNVSGTLKPELGIKFAKDYPKDPSEDVKDLIIGGVKLVSCFFIILLLVVYALCKDLRTTPGAILMSCVAVFAINFLLVTVREFTLIDKSLFPPGCYVLCVLISFFTMSSFCWMSIMSFNIWWTLRSMFYNHTCPGKSVDYRKFAWYCCFAFVPSTIYVVVEVCLNEFTEAYSPKYGSCTVNASSWHYGAVLLPLQALIIVLFIMTVYNLCRIQRSTQGHLNNSNSGSTGPATKTAVIIIKISVMMGINWFMDLLLLFYGDDIPMALKYAANLYNCLIGVIMFLINVMKADVLLKLFRKLSINNKITRHLERRVSKQHSGKSKSSQRTNSTSTFAMTSHQDPVSRDTDYLPSDHC